MRKFVKLMALLCAFCLLAAACVSTPQKENVKEAIINELPVMDGSTSLIPLEAGIRAALYGISFYDAKAQVVHSTTWGAFYNLLRKNADLIFSCPLSEQQREELKAAKVEFTEIPVTMEGFVFAVNAKNPVDTLTQQQIKDIYSGKITNWKELGGNDEEIIAYQRNNDSGSQNYMIDFMGDTSLMEAPTSLIPTSMGGLMDAIAVNDNAVNAIGYSVYAYAADMYANSDSVKFIKVDGVAPNRATMASREYPLLDYNYAMFRSDEAENSVVRKLVDFILSEEGQMAVANAGYVAVKDIDYDYSAVKGKLYDGTGAGGSAPVQQASYEYVLQDGFEYRLPVGTHEDGTKTYLFTALKDEEICKDINAFLLESVKELEGEKEEFERYVSASRQFSKDSENGQFTKAVVTAKNGYLSAAVTIEYENHFTRASGNSSCCYDARTATWDLRTGKRLREEELFFDGVDINSVLSDFIRLKSTELDPDLHTSLYELQADITGLPETGWHLTHAAIFFDHTNAFFAGGTKISLADLPRGTMVTEVPYDMHDLFDRDEAEVVKRFVEWQGNIIYTRLLDGQIPFGLFDPSVYPAAEKINETMTNFAESHFSPEALQSLAEEHGDDFYEFYGWFVKEYLGKYAVYFVAAPSYSPYIGTYIYDLKTGEELHWYDLLKEGWQEHVILNEPDNSFDLDTAVNLSLAGILGSSENMFTIALYWDKPSDSRYHLSVPYEYVNWE